jgi:hypothetical protein
MYPGLDVSEWDPRLLWLWRWSNLRIVGFYLSHGAGQTYTTWTNHWHDLRDIGWGILPLWLPFGSAGIGAMATANGTAHGQVAVERARAAKLEIGATIYLDIESPVFDAMPNALPASKAGFLNYVNNWMQAVRGGGYAPGAYCSRLDAALILNHTVLRPHRPVIWPFAVANSTRAGWDDNTFQLSPNVPNDWLVTDATAQPDPDQGAWVQNNDTFGCQYDWFSEDRDRKIFHWPGANGHQSGFRSVDWDMGKVFDPTHPRAAGVVVAASDRENRDWVRVFGVHTSVLDYLERNVDGRFGSGQNLRNTVGDIGPVPAAAVNGFDPTWASAVSRRHRFVDLFLLGQDGFVRTLWANNQETFPNHPWVLNPDNIARRGSPVSAVSRVVDQLDVFYISTGHQLVTQWWNPGQTDWTRNVRVLAGPLVAGGSNLATLPTPNDAASPSDRLDVFYISLDFTQPANSPQWGQAWQVVHAVWRIQADWQVTPIPDFIDIAGQSGVACARDNAENIHVVAQNRNRAGLRHAILQRGSASWTISVGPVLLPSALQTPTWWMSLHLMAFGDRVLLLGVTNLGMLAWSVYAGGHWSNVGASNAPFATSRPLALARRGSVALDVIGISEQGEIVAQSVTITQTGSIIIGPANM